jgi:hypothetical protein
VFVFEFIYLNTFLFSASPDDTRFMGMTLNERDEMLRRCALAVKDIDALHGMCEQVCIECTNDVVYVNRCVVVLCTVLYLFV